MCFLNGLVLLLLLPTGCVAGGMERQALQHASLDSHPQIKVLGNLRRGLCMCSLLQLKKLQTVTFLRGVSFWPVGAGAFCCCCSVTQSDSLLLWTSPGFLVFHYLPEFAQIHDHWVDDAIQPSHSLPSPFHCPQSFSTSGSFPKRQLLASDCQSIEASASTSVLPLNIQR